MSLYLRTTDANGRSYGGFQWPFEVGAIVTAPDWNPEPVCGGGLHGLLNGLGNSAHLSFGSDAIWWIVEADNAVGLGGQYKFRSCRVVAFGPRHEITAALYKLAPGPINGLCLIGGGRATLTGGDWSTLTGGYKSTLTGGGRSTLTGGYGSTLTGGYGSTLTGHEASTLTGGDWSKLTGGDWSALTGGEWSTLVGGDKSTLIGGDGSTLIGGYGSTLTGGDESMLIFKRQIKGRRRVLTAYVGEDGIKPGVAYRANDDHTAVEEVK